jgi:hypothetical protein
MPSSSVSTIKQPFLNIYWHVKLLCHYKFCAFKSVYYCYYCDSTCRRPSWPSSAFFNVNINGCQPHSTRIPDFCTINVNDTLLTAMIIVGWSCLMKLNACSSKQIWLNLMYHLDYLVKHYAMKVYGEWMYRSTFSAFAALAAGEWSTSCPSRFTTGERATGTHSTGGWVDPRASLDDLKKRKFLTLLGLELRPLSRPAHNQSLYWLHYPSSF